MLNRHAVELGILAALALECRVAPESVFARKNYFYPDLPKGYQISQYEQPLATDGRLTFAVAGEPRTVRIRRVHLEEDAGKSLHGDDAVRAAGHAEGYSLLDFNRCGVPLIEIVTEPDLRAPEEARSFLETLKLVLEYTGVSDVKLEEGSLRCDANISLRPKGSGESGVAVEIKNLNSFRFVQRALAHEIERQAALLDAGRPVVRETRQYLEATGTTAPLRGKEEAQDYRYFPDPDLVRLVVDAAWQERLQARLPEMPAAKHARYLDELGLPEHEARVLTSSLPLSSFFEQAIAQGGEPRAVANWTVGELCRLMNAHAVSPCELKLTPAHLVELLQLLDAGTLSRPLAREVLEASLLTGNSPRAVAQARGMTQISNEAELTLLVDRVLSAHPGPVADYLGGKERALGFLVGQVMRASGGRANPQTVGRLLKEKLGREG